MIFGRAQDTPIGININGFEYTASVQVCEELRQQVGDRSVDNKTAWQIPTQLELNSIAGLQRITEMPIYSVDALVRRAGALQNTVDATQVSGIHINTPMATQMGLSANNIVKVKQNGTAINLPVVIDERVPNESVLIYAGQLDNVELGAWHGQVELTAVS